MKQYEKYKAADKIFGGEIPEHWAEYKMKYLVDPSRYYQIGDGDHGSIKPEMYSVDDGIPYLRVQNLSWTGELLNEGLVFITQEIQDANSKSKLLPDDLLIAKTGATIGKLGIIPHSLKEANTTSSVGKITVNKKRFFPRFVLYSMMSKQFKDQIWIDASQKSAQPGFNVDDLIFYKIVSPPSLDEQTTIANYLDDKTTQISQLISNKQKLVELLKEERTSIINEAVSGKGKNWERKKLKYIIKDFESGVSVNATDEPVDSNEELGVLKTSCVYNYIFEANENKRILGEEISRVSCPVRGNSIIMSRMNTPELVGASGFVEIDYPNLFLPDRLWQTVLQKNVQLDVKWLSYLFVSNSFRQEMTSKATGTSSSMKNLSKSDVLDIRITFPALKDQTAIVQHIHAETQRIDNIISKIGKEIDLMQEYKTALISEVVTGKIKVI